MKTDVAKRYIDWAVENGFQVVDVNIPNIISIEDVTSPVAPLCHTLT
jgi:hypothetical protein